VVTNASGTPVEVTDYYPYGSIRLDERSGSFSEQRKYIGQAYDQDTGLNYLNARYYASAVGQFVSQDPAFLAVGDGDLLKSEINQDQAKYLSDPQGLNAYSYAGDNPITRSDPAGKDGSMAADMADFGLLDQEFISTAAVSSAVAVATPYALAGAAGATAVLTIPSIFQWAAADQIVNSTPATSQSINVSSLNMWGSRYAGQVQTINLEEIGLGQPPMGLDDMKPSNKGPKNFWKNAALIGVGAASVAADLYAQFQEHQENANNFENRIQSQQLGNSGGQLNSASVQYVVPAVYARGVGGVAK